MLLKIEEGTTVGPLYRRVSDIQTISPYQGEISEFKSTITFASAGANPIWNSTFPPEVIAHVIAAYNEPDSGSDALLTFPLDNRRYQTPVAGRILEFRLKELLLHESRIDHEDPGHIIVRSFPLSCSRDESTPLRPSAGMSPPDKSPVP